MTAADRPGWAEGGSPGSVRHPPAGLALPIVGLALLLVVTELVDAIRIVGPAWQGGDLLYHSALAHAILRGELPPGGPYAGLPTYYPPGFQVMLAAVMGGLGLDAVRADQLLTLVWLPVLPIGTFLLVRRLTGRPWVAVLAATLTVFGGAYNLHAGRLWVNSLFMAGQETYPLYPRDVVFALLPFATLAFLRGLTASRPVASLAWALVAGGLLGVGALVQVQLLLPIPVSLGTVVLAVAIRRPELRRRAIGVLVVVAIVGVGLLAPWLLSQLDAIQRNGGVALDSADSLAPARFGPWSYPREFGLLLPFGLVGAGVSLLFVRRPDGPRPGGDDLGSWRPAVPEEALGLVAWFGLAFVLGVSYRPDWPLEDALRPQRLWLIAGQPMAALAAIGLVAAAEDLTGRLRPSRIASRTLTVGLMAAAGLAICLPSTVATVRLLAATWTVPGYAALDLQADHVASFGELVPPGGPRATVLTYEDWSSLAWFETGDTVVGLLPAGYAKLAYDPAIFTGHGQSERRADVLRAFDGDPVDLAAVAATYDAASIVLARRGAALGAFDAMAVPAAAGPGALIGTAEVVTGNGWDALAMQPGTTLDFATRIDGRIHLEIRLAPAEIGVSTPERRFDVAAVGADGAVRSSVTVQVPVTRTDPWQIAVTDLDLTIGDRLRLEALDPLTVQSVRGFLPADGLLAVGSSPIPGWRVTVAMPNAVALEPIR